MKKILLIAIVLGTTLCQAQPTTYAEDKRAKDNKAYNDAYIDALRKNTNSTPANTGGVDPKAAQELADLFAARAGRKTKAQTEAEQTARVDAYIKKEKEEFDATLARAFRGSDNYVAAKGMQKPLIEKYTKAGFDENDATYMAQLEITSDDTGVFKHSYPYHISGVESVTELRRIEKTGTFEDVLMVILDIKEMVGAPFTSLKALEDLNTRFPEKTAVINKAKGETFSTFFMSHNFDVFTQDISNCYKNPKVKSMTDRWYALFQSDPLTAMEGVNSVSVFHPLTILAAVANSNKDYKKAAALGKVLLLCPVLAGLKFSEQGKLTRIFHTASSNYILKHERMKADRADKVHVPYTAEEVRQMAAAQNITPMKFIDAIASPFLYQTSELNLLYKKFDADSNWKFKKLIGDLADGGDVEARAFLARMK